MTRVFVDTSAIYALLVADDQMHAASRSILAGLEERDALMVTSSFVVQESVALLQARSGIGAVRTFQAQVFPALEIEWVTQRIYERAIAALLAAASRDVSLADWTSFEIMRETAIRQAFAFDPHFSDQGFELLSPS